jgi:hypothetical protein
MGVEEVIPSSCPLLSKGATLRAAAGLVVFSCGTGLVKRVHFAETQLADTPQARCRYTRLPHGKSIVQVLSPLMASIPRGFIHRARLHLELVS